MPAIDMRPTPMVLRLLIAHVAVWMLFSILANFSGQAWARALHDQHLTLHPSEVLFEGQLWQLVTYNWLHALRAPSHILFNMLGLFFLGPALERRWGPRAFLRFWLLCAFIAGLVTVLAGVLIPGVFDREVLGASGAVLGVVAGFSFTMPNATLLLFFVLPIQARWVVWIVVGLDTITFLANPHGSNTAWQTHLGGVLAAWLLITGNWRPSTLRKRLKLQRLKAQQRATRRGGFDVIRGDRDRKGGGRGPLH